MTFSSVFVYFTIMLVIRFQRVGRRNDPAYRIVVAERRSKPHSIGVETVGSYHPKTKHAILKNERILYWIGKGAQVSATAHNLLVKKGVVKAKKRPAAKVPAQEKASTPTASQP